MKPTGLLPSLPTPARGEGGPLREGPHRRRTIEPQLGLGAPAGPRPFGIADHGGKPVDLVYNRLTDFSLDAAVNADLRAIFDADGVVVTPHPRAHALYADKRNLMLLSDEAALIEIGVPEATRKILLAGIPRTVAVKAEEVTVRFEEGQPVSIQSSSRMNRN